MTKHIQFYADVGYTSEDLNDLNNLKNTKVDLTEEEYEERAKLNFNILFESYYKRIEEIWNTNI